MWRCGGCWVPGRELPVLHGDWPCLAQSDDGAGFSYDLELSRLARRPLGAQLLRSQEPSPTFPTPRRWDQCWVRFPKLPLLSYRFFFLLGFLLEDTCIYRYIFTLHVFKNVYAEHIYLKYIFLEYVYLKHMWNIQVFHGLYVMYTCIYIWTCMYAHTHVYEPSSLCSYKIIDLSKYFLRKNYSIYKI